MKQFSLVVRRLLAPWRTLLALAFVLSPSAHAADNWAPNLTVAGTWDSNATNADVTADQIDSLRLDASLLASQRYPFGRDDALLATGRFGAEWWPRYRSLLSGSAGGRLEWRHQFGSDPLAPVIALEGAADIFKVKQPAYSGVATGATLSVSKRFNEHTRGTFAHEVSWFNARYGVFDRGASETSLKLDRDVNKLTRLTFAARFRDGDIVSYASGDRPDLVALAPQNVLIDTFTRLMTAHRIDARTWSARAALARALDDDSAVVVAYEWRDTKRDTLRFSNHLVSVSLVHQF